MSFVTEALYNGSDINTSIWSNGLTLTIVIKADLDYIVTNWQIPTFDLWEEVLGAHFYTRMVFQFLTQLMSGTIPRTHGWGSLCIHARRQFWSADVHQHCSTNSSSHLFFC